MYPVLRELFDTDCKVPQKCRTAEWKFLTEREESTMFKEGMPAIEI